MKAECLPKAARHYIRLCGHETASPCCWTRSHSCIRHHRTDDALSPAEACRNPRRCPPDVSFAPRLPGRRSARERVPRALFADTQRVMAAIGADDWLSRHFVFTGLSSAGVSPRTGVRDCRALVAFATGGDSVDDWRGAAFRFKPGRKIAAGGELTALRDTPKLEKLSACRGSSLVERRPEKAGVASSILAPGTIRTSAQQIPITTDLVALPLWRKRDFRTVLRKLRLGSLDVAIQQAVK